jgi:valyl-tRNA synthetase
MELQKDYDYREVEKKWVKEWEKKGIYKFNPNLKGEVYSVDTPPPTVSGKMHIGHAFSYSQQDFAVRFRRMNQPVFYPFGTDDNGLPTERLVEKINKVKSKKMSRSEFIELCLKTLKDVTPDFVQDWKNLGISADYETCYSTIDRNCQKISQQSFLELFKKGLVYKKEFPTIWCPECQTSIAQAELEDKSLKSFFTTIKFEVDGKGILIATTRPELLPACVALCVHPDDKRYKSFVGKKAKVPLFNLEVPVIADRFAEMEKGTGAMMMCSYGDKFDVEFISKHKLAPRIILNKNGTLKIKNYEGLKTKEAREQILSELKSRSLIAKQEQIEHPVNCHDKCGTEIEFLPAEQWFIKILDKKEELIRQGKKVKWYPESMYKRYENWVKGLEWDWNVSRDRHFGIPIPVWECKKCRKIILPEEKELPVDPLKTKKNCPHCSQETVPEEKVLDTWATSSLTPQIISSLVKNNLSIPYSLRPQAHDIIRTWAFYTITRSYLSEKKIPWKDIMISGFVTLSGEKMSKSKGNVIAPQDVLEKFGADALRFWASTSKLGEDLDYREQELVAGKKFLTKLWNASKFVMMHLKDYRDEKPEKLEEVDAYLLQSLSELERKTKEMYLEYNISGAKREIETFFWHTFCDNYLEIVKDRLYDENEKRKQQKISAKYTLKKVLVAMLKMMAPITPFITEEIYQHLRKKDESSIHTSKWPEMEVRQEKKIMEAGDRFMEIVSEIRRYKAKNNLSMKEEINLALPKSDESLLGSMLNDLKSVSKAREIKFGKEFSIRKA